jgi:predicted ribosome quality control (RQC) complex YloA/Tae2 family protein
MDIKKIKQFLGERGIDKHLRIERNGGGQYLYNLLFEFNNIVKKETKNKIIKEMENVDITD